MLIGCLHFAFLMPIWSAYAEATTSKDFTWVKNALRKSILYTVLAFIAAIVFFAVFGNNLIYIWTGKRITSVLLFILLGFHALINGWTNCFSVFLNSVGILKGQIVLSFIGAIILIPISFYFSQIFGLLGICFALILVVIPIAIYNPIRSYIYIKNRK
jgi:O-antigen/teichoic acid export membrane protein